MIKMFPNINNMKIYLVCGKTNLRKGIDGLAALVTEALIASVTASAKSALGRAKNYALGQEKNILNIFEKGYFELSNNSAERAVKESVMGRKNWLFSSTFEGARANAVALSLIYTAKLNQLDPEKYLRKVLTEITNIEVFDPERFRQLLPWNIDLTS